MVVAYLFPVSTCLVKLWKYKEDEKPPGPCSTLQALGGAWSQPSVFC